MNKVVRLFGMTTYVFMGSIIALIVLYFITQSITVTGFGIAIFLFAIKIMREKYVKNDYYFFNNRRAYNAASKRIRDDLNILKYLKSND
jgi:type IV secretory pathway TrbD component